MLHQLTDGWHKLNSVYEHVTHISEFLLGFSNIPHIRYFYVFLCFVYIMTVLGNGFLLSVIWLVKTLHTPKYMIVFNMALTDLCGSTALIPKLLDTFLFDRRYIFYDPCLSYMFFVVFFASMQSWTLVAMAYDRLIAICLPLRYHSIVTETSIAAVLLSEDYVKRRKIAMASYIDPNARMINYTLTHTIPPLLNPIVYALKTEEVKNAIKKLCKRNNVSNTVTKC
ncbi:4-galactosyl-N-acetylglucosaminide 3-alpha-L-fucosyltransferase [Sarotherodon galilaeus]